MGEQGPEHARAGLTEPLPQRRAPQPPRRPHHLLRRPPGLPINAHGLVLRRVLNARAHGWPLPSGGLQGLPVIRRGTGCACGGGRAGARCRGSGRGRANRRGVNRRHLLPPTRGARVPQFTVERAQCRRVPLRQAVRRQTGWNRVQKLRKPLRGGPGKPSKGPQAPFQKVPEHRRPGGDLDALLGKTGLKGGGESRAARRWTI